MARRSGTQILPHVVLIALCALPLRGAPAQESAQASRPLARGTVLVLDDMTGAGRDSLVGWVTRRVVQAGEPLRTPAIAPRTIVRAGSSVTARTHVAGISIERTAVAAAHGAFGDTILVRVGDRNRLRAVIVDSATVRLLPASETLR